MNQSVEKIPNFRFKPSAHDPGRTLTLKTTIKSKIILEIFGLDYSNIECSMCKLYNEPVSYITENDYMVQTECWKEKDRLVSATLQSGRLTSSFKMPAEYITEIGVMNLKTIDGNKFLLNREQQKTGSKDDIKRQAYAFEVCIGVHYHRVAK